MSSVGGNKLYFHIEDETNKEGNDTLSDGNGIIYLNIGGHKFETSLLTLRKDPNSMLYAMFSGIYKLKKDRDGAYFIDRDGTHFRYILNYLRDGSVDVMNDEQQLKQLLREAQYFQVNCEKNIVNMKR